MFVAVSLLALVSFIAGTREFELRASVGQAIGIQSSNTIDTNSIQQTYQFLAKHYDGNIDNQVLIDGANSGMVDAVGNKYTQYFTSEEAKEYQDQLEGSIGGGIGIEVAMRDKKATVVRTLDDNPAYEAGVRKKDVIIKINGEDVREKDLQYIIGKIRGEIGTTVELMLQRGKKELTVSVTREEVNNPSVEKEIIGKVGILTVTRFDSQTGALARKATQSMVDEGIEAVILDLRGDGGGYVDGAIDLAGLWLNDKIVLTQKVKDAVVSESKTDSRAIIGDLPTVVLMDGGTASASEIVAGALRDYGKATLMGVKSFGKGSVQQIFDLDRGAQLKVTIAKWYTPKGTNIDANGLKPDAVVDISQKDINSDKDPQLDAALKQLQTN